MNSLRSIPHLKNRARAFTLVFSLIFITLLAVLIVGFMISMRVERCSANAHLQATKAQCYAQAGVDVIIARIRQAMQSGSFAISQPGQIVTTSIAGGTLATPTIYDLHSGTATVTDKNVAIDLNLKHSSDISSRNLISSSPVNLYVKWIYMRKDGTLVTGSDTGVPSYDASNPLVGRFAYWADDGCSRINLNTAYTRSASDSGTAPSHPTQVNLLFFSNDGLTSSNLSALKDFRTGTSPSYGHYFNSLDEARGVNTAISSLISEEKFSLGVTSRTPDLNIFGTPRIVLTTQKNLAGDAPFLDILATANTDPGPLENLDASKVNSVVSTLSAIFMRTDWPYKPGKSFKDKFGSVRPQQIALNILEYVRSRESSENVCAPLRGSADTTGTGFTVENVGTGTDTSQDDVQGLTRNGVKITEYGFYLSKVAGTSGASAKYNVILKMEVYLPKYGGIDQLNLNGWTLFCQVQTREKDQNGNMNGAPIFKEENGTLFFSNSFTISGATTLNAGDYEVISLTFPTSYTFDTPSYNRSDSLGFLTTLVLKNQDGIKMEEVDRAGCERMVCPIDSSNVAEGSISTLAIDDPFTSAGGWVSTASGSNGGPTLGSAPNMTLGTTKTVDDVAQQDTDTSGKLTDISLRMPAPKGTTASTTGQILNPTGIMQSVAELGFIHTGNDPQFTKKSYSVVPWRTLRLQPKKDSTTLPDWALLDVFSVPVKSDSVETLPASIAVSTGSCYLLGGRINLNAAIVPFSDGGSAISRSAPLQAVLYGAASSLSGKYPATETLSSTTTTASMATDLINFTVATGNNPGNQYGFPYYLSRGELAEVDQIANGGEASEELLRNTVDLLTTQSNVFVIYSVGQAIKQLSSGTVNVLAEKRLETIVSTGTNRTTVRPFYSRSLKP